MSPEEEVENAARALWINDRHEAGLSDSMTWADLDEGSRNAYRAAVSR